MQIKCRKERYSLDTHPIEIERMPLIHKESNVLALGSCFAFEIQNWLHDRGYHVLNKSMPKQLLWYNTYTILYELQRLTNDYNYQVPAFAQKQDDYWRVTKKDRNYGMFQDPYRRCIFAENQVALWQMIDSINAKMDAHLRSADVLIITLGLTEVFYQPKNGQVICACPGYGKGGGEKCIFKMSRFSENLNNMRNVMKILRAVNPTCEVIVTVSPVAMASTYRDIDHLVANTESKSILRSVAGQIVDEYDNAHYFHSYELALNTEDVFRWDGRHVAPEFVNGTIMPDFARFFVE